MVINELREFILSDYSQAGTGVVLVDIYPVVKPYISKVLNKSAPANPMGGPWSFYAPAVLRQCEWFQFYDLIETIAKLVQAKLGSEAAQQLEERINTILAAEGIPWQLRGTSVARRIGAPAEKVLCQAQTLLADPRFRGPDEQFSKAVEHLNRRPKPDEENCAKDAVGAVEGVANILANTKGQQLNVLLSNAPFRGRLPVTIRLCVDKLYAYRGATPGVGHSLIGEPVVDADEALWVLQVAAATIILLVNRFRGTA